MEERRRGYAVSMSRLVLAALFTLLVMAPAAHAATVGVYDDPTAVDVALAGPDVLVLSANYRTNTARLVAVPRTGGRGQTVLTVKGFEGLLDEGGILAASAQRVALLVGIEDGRSRTVEYRVYSGPPRGPLQVVRRVPVREGWAPMFVSVDGDRALILEGRQEPDGPLRGFLYDSVSGLVPLPWVRASAAPIAISGPYAAAYMAGPNRAAVLDLATGAELATIAMQDRAQAPDLALASDGRIALATRKAGITIAGPGVVARTIPGTSKLSNVHLSGDAVTATDADGRAVAVAADGKLTALGPPTYVLGGVVGDAQGYAWLANGCVRHTSIPLTPGARDAPCPTTEVSLAYIASTTLRGRTVTLPVGCTAAPKGVCRGTAIARIFEGGPKIVARGRFAIPVGRSRTVKMTLTRAAAAQFRREGYGQLVPDAQIKNGRVGVGSNGDAELGVKVPGTRR